MTQALFTKGIITPMLTPFDQQGEIKKDSIQSIVDFQAPHVSGFFVCGSFSSGMMMEIDERKQVLELITDANQKHNKILISHVGTTSTKATLELTKHAQQVGVQAVAALVPYYYPHSDDAILRHFEQLVKSTSLPVYFYDYPEYAGRKVDLPLLHQLVQVGVVGVKDTTGGIQTMQERIIELPVQKFDYMIGSESLLAEAFNLGVQACISGLSNAFPELAHALFLALSNHEQEESQRLQATINDVRKLMRIGPKMESIYAALHMRGVDCGLPRLPFNELPQDIYQKMQSGLSNLQLL